MSFLLDNGTEIKSIDSKNPDYFQWGLNCKNLNLSYEDARKTISSEWENLTEENKMDFLDGYS